MSEGRLRFRPDFGGEVGDGGMADGRGGENMKSAQGCAPPSGREVVGSDRWADAGGQRSVATVVEVFVCDPAGVASNRVVMGFNEIGWTMAGPLECRY